MEHNRFTSWFLLRSPALMRRSNARAWRKYRRHPERFETLHRPVVDAFTHDSDLNGGVPADWTARDGLR